MIGRLSHFIKHKSKLVWAESDLHNSRRVGESRLPSHIVSSSFIRIGHGMWKQQQLKWVNTTGQNPEYFEVHEHWDTTVNETFTLSFLCHKQTSDSCCPWECLLHPAVEHSVTNTQGRSPLVWESGWHCHTTVHQLLSAYKVKHTRHFLYILKLALFHAFFVL